MHFSFDIEHSFITRYTICYENWKRTIWHASSCTHWDIRRRATLKLHDSSQTPYFPNDKEAEKIATDLWGENSHLKKCYERSCYGTIKSRFRYYKYALPARDGYRRVSLYFNMHLDPSCDLRVYAKPDETPKIFLSSGVVLAIEEISHLIVCQTNQIFFNENFNLWPYTSSMTLTTAAVDYRARSCAEILQDYSRAFSPTKCPELKNYEHAVRGSLNAAAPDHDDVAFYMQIEKFSFLHTCFSLVSGSSTRQEIADHFSALSLTSLIAHEDAHLYLEHLNYFFDVAGELEFNESASNLSDEQYFDARRASELDADTAATMRQVDLAYDTEFLGMLFDRIDPNVRHQVWSGRSEGEGLNFGQRNFVLRFIIGSLIVPAITFEQSRIRSGESESPEYDPLFIRILNILQEAFNRALDVQKHQPHYRTGRVDDCQEVYALVTGVMSDSMVIYLSLLEELKSCGEKRLSFFSIGADLEIFYSEEMALFFTSFLCSMRGIPMEYFFTNQSEQIAFALRSKSFEARKLIREFIIAKINSYEKVINVFVKPRMLANRASEVRINKINEDMEIAKERLTFYMNQLSIYE